jgi:peroxiredoxin
MRKIFLLVSVMALSLAMVSCSQASNTELVTAEEFTIPDIEGNPVSLSDYKGKSNVLLFFWTTWCPFCRQELKKLNSKAGDLETDGLQVLTINVGESKEKVIKYFKANAIVFKALVDENTAVSDLYRIGGVPTFFLIDTNGKVVLSENYFPGNYKEILSQN